ncbi:MAG TPA: DUF488 domain-containing protein [Candidatus Thermoplasmatota archaeon]|nr:DUF488 domain-containing protein [Candidatus Thermoplasmatota archaeon]
MSARRVWTIGYEGHSPESLIGRLRKAKIQRLVDVRELPLSRKAGFSKSSLALGLSHASIAYTHAKPLGTPRAIRHAYKAGGSLQEFRAAYRAHLRGQKAALAALEEQAGAQRCVLLCVEADAEACHRHVLAEILRARGWEAIHL